MSLRAFRDYAFITLGTFLVAVGYCVFVLPEKVVIGGVTGIGSIVYFITGWPLAIGVVQYGINLLLLGIAWKIVGGRFVRGTIFGATMMSLFMMFIPMLMPHVTAPDGAYTILPLVPDQAFMNVIIGALISGIGLGMVFINGGSTGGTDIVATIVSQKTNAGVGRVMLYVDFCIISSSFLIFHELPSVVYGFIYLLIATYMVDLVIGHNRQSVQLTIFSPHWKEIAQTVSTYGRRGVTVVEAMGWYTQKPTKMLLIYVRRSEAITIYRIVKSIDPDAFAVQTQVSAVYGRGFDHLHLKD